MGGGRPHHEPEDPRASYLVLDDDGLEFRRVEYDVEKAAADILAQDELSEDCRRQMAMWIRRRW